MIYDNNKFSMQNNISASNVPMIPLPPTVGNPAPNPDNIPVVPLPPIVGNPAPNPDNIPVVPLPPIVGNPAPNPDNIPAVPFPPIVTNEYCTVRFLNAALGYGPLNITIGAALVVSNLSFRNLSAYNRIQDGFYFVMVTSARNPGNVLFRGRVPFNSGEIITMAIVKAANGVNFVRISDQPCKNRPKNRGCIRAVNLIYNSPAMNIILTDGRIAFSDIRYKEVTSYKQARAGEYNFYVAQSPYSLTPALIDSDILDNLPIVLTNFLLPGYGELTPLVSSYVIVQAGNVYTIYLFGNWETSSEVQVKVL